MGWIAIGTFVLGILWSVFVWALGRHIKRTDALEAAINGKEGKGGLRDQVASLLTKIDFERHAEKIDGTLEVLNDEGQQRERRIMEAINRTGERFDRDMRELRRELGETNRRVDGMSRTGRRTT